LVSREYPIDFEGEQLAHVIGEDALCHSARVAPRASATGGAATMVAGGHTSIYPVGSRVTEQHYNQNTGGLGSVGPDPELDAPVPRCRVTRGF
jgi:hypothetical protein